MSRDRIEQIEGIREKLTAFETFLQMHPEWTDRVLLVQLCAAPADDLLPHTRQHLALLRRDRIIAARRDGQTVWYSLASGPARDVMQSLYAAYCAPSTLELGERGAHDQDAGRKQRALMEQTYTLKGERR